MNMQFNNNSKTVRVNCKVPFYPNFKPSIYSLSVYSSTQGYYQVVYIAGTNFLPPPYGYTYVNFGGFKNLQITFYTTETISFIVPINSMSGIYNVTVVNIYNSNFSPSVNSSYPGNPNVSNSVEYTIISE